RPPGDEAAELGNHDAHAVLERGRGAAHGGPVAASRPAPRGRGAESVAALLYQARAQRARAFALPGPPRLLGQRLPRASLDAARGARDRVAPRRAALPTGGR